MSALTSLYRSATRHRLFALLNIGGLALGIAVFLVLATFVRNEWSFDRSLPGWEKVWIVQEQYFRPGDPPYAMPYTSGGELDLLRSDFPGLKGARYNGITGIVLRGDAATKERLATVDPEFFDLFPFPVLAGNIGTTLADPNGIVITRDVSARYFGTGSAIGQTLPLMLNGVRYRYRVGAVLKDLPENTSITSQMFVPLVRSRFADANFDHWGSTSLMTYLQFPDAGAARVFERQLPAFLKRRVTGENREGMIGGQYRQTLLARSEMRLSYDYYRAFVTTLGLIGVLTLLIAIVNYVNLATARAGLRAREVAVRKVLGGTRRMLVRQFLVESIATVALAALIGLALAEIALPFFSFGGGLKATMHYWGADGVLILLVPLTIAVGIVAGLYPAVVLATFQPAAVLASARAPGGGRTGARVRSALVVVQFAIAIAFAIGTSVMIGQIAHVRDAAVGFQRDGLVLVRSFADRSLAPAQKAELLDAFAKIPGISGVAVADDAPGDQNSTNSSTLNRPKTPDRRPPVTTITVGPGYFTTYGARLLAGRWLDPARGGDEAGAGPDTRRTNVILNAAAVRELGFANPQDAIGQRVEGKGSLMVVGVVGDIRFQSPRVPVPPSAYFLSRRDISDAFASLRYTGSDPRIVVDRIERVWKRIAPAVPYDARTVEQNMYDQLYKFDDQNARLFTIGAALAILIGCVGLYGLAAFDTARRVKEIGIRKTLGASTANVLTLLIGQFLRPVLLANLIAWPIAFVVMRRWLAFFDDRIALSPAFFVGASLAAVLIASATVLGQAWRVSRAEPARALRYE